MNRQDLIRQLPGVLLPWYDTHARDLPWRRDKEPYHVWLSEIMLQQTRVEAVKGYYSRFLAALPTIEALALAKEDRLLKLWEGLGYYNRARNLQKAANMVMSQFQGTFPCDYQALVSLPGIGEYTAGAIGSICFDLPTPAVDGNVLRVISRVTESYEVIDEGKVKRGISDALEKVYPPGQCGDFTQSLMELGATVCIPVGVPLCGSCPAAGFCLSYLHGTTDKLPVRKEKKKRRREKKTVFLFLHEGETAVRKREEQGVLCGMWEFPNVPGSLTKKEAVVQAEIWGVSPKTLEQVLKRNHIFTHIQWEMTAYVFQCDKTPPCFVWVRPEQMEREIALPSAFKQFV